MSSYLNETIQHIRERRAVHRFSRQDVPEPLLYEVLDAANWAPSGFNLQPWYFVIVRDVNLRKLLSFVALDQAQVSEAPLTVVLVANPDAWKEEYRKVLHLAEESGFMKPGASKFYRKIARLTFQTGPFGLFGFAKRLILPILRLRRPLGSPMTSRAERRAYVRAQTMLAAQNFMIAARSVGLDTCPMEGFDEERLKKLLAIPRNMTVPIIIPTGYRLEDARPSVRLPLHEKVRLDLFSNIKK